MVGRVEEETRRGGKDRATMTHERWEVGNDVVCRRCGRSEAGEGTGRKALDDACLGSAGGASAGTHHG